MNIDYKAMKLLENYVRSTTDQPFECRVIHKTQVFNNVQWIFSCNLECIFIVSYDGYRNHWHLEKYIREAGQVIEGDE